MQTADLNSPVIPQRLLTQHQQCSPVIDQLIQKAGRNHRSFCWKFSLSNLKWRPKTYSETWKLNSVILYFDYGFIATTFSIHSKLQFVLNTSRRQAFTKWKLSFQGIKIIWDNLIYSRQSAFLTSKFLRLQFQRFTMKFNITITQGKLKIIEPHKMGQILIV